MTPRSVSEAVFGPSEGRDPARPAWRTFEGRAVGAVLAVLAPALLSLPPQEAATLARWVILALIASRTAIKVAEIIGGTRPPTEQPPSP